MDDNQRVFTLYGKPPLLQLVYSFLIIIVIGIFLFFILLLAGTFFFGSDLGTLYNNSLTNSGEKGVEFLRYMVISQDISFFIIPGLIIMTLMKPFHQDGFVNFKIPGTIEVILVIILAFCIFPVTSFAGELNSAMHLPEWMTVVEEWMNKKEDEATRLIGLLINSNTFLMMILNLFIIAVIPAIGEEFIFRGVFQKIFYRLFKSGHLAVLVTAIFFSAIHLQFFGFFPRLILGLVFGYLYLWSGNLWLSVIVHFVNNAVPVIGTYIYGWEKTTGSLDITLSRQMIGLPIPVIIGAMILFYFKRNSKMDSD